MPQNSPILVLHVSGDEARIAEARLDGSVVELTDVCSFVAAKTGTDARPLSDQTTLDNLNAWVTEHNGRGRDLRVTLGGAHVACHFFDMPPLTGSALEQAVRLKLAQQLHFDAAKAIVAIHKLPGSVLAGQVRVSAAALDGDVAQSVVDFAQHCGLDLVHVTVAPAVLASTAARDLAADQESGALLYQDERSSTLIVFRNGQPIVLSDLPLGLADLTAALMRPIISGSEVLQLDEAKALALRNEVGLPQADQAIESLGIRTERLLPLLEPVLQKWIKLLTQWLTFASTTMGAGAIKTLTIVGPGRRTPGLCEALASRLSMEVRPGSMLEGRVRLAGQANEEALDSATVMAGAVACRSDLPDLTPPTVRKERRLRRARKAVTLASISAATALLLLGVLLHRVARNTEPQVTRHRAELESVQDVLAEKRRRLTRQEEVHRIRQDLSNFSAAGAGWLGVFKELSILLPAELTAREYVARYVDGGVTMKVTADVEATGGQTFDQLVSQTLLLLQRSAFFNRVELVSANRVEPSEQYPGATGSIAVELNLAYAPRTRGPGA